jgi:ubiquinone/menaquinone biosynthesis C-methylase UbiE
MNTKQTQTQTSDKTQDRTASNHAKRWSFLRRTPAFFSRFEAPGILGRIQPWIQPSQVAVDLGCGWGYFSFQLAEMVGPGGKVLAVDLGEACIRSIQKKAVKKGLHNIEAFAASAAKVGFIPSASVDFVLANGLLCSMECDRPQAVAEMNRILKPGGHAYISLGSPPPFGLVDQAEWQQILSCFTVKQGGSFKELWALVECA